MRTLICVSLAVLLSAAHGEPPKKRTVVTGGSSSSGGGAHEGESYSSTRVAPSYYNPGYSSYTPTYYSGAGGGGYPGATLGSYSGLGNSLGYGGSYASPSYSGAGYSGAAANIGAGAAGYNSGSSSSYHSEGPSYSSAPFKPSPQIHNSPALATPASYKGGAVLGYSVGASPSLLGSYKGSNLLPATYGAPGYASHLAGLSGFHGGYAYPAAYNQGFSLYGLGQGGLAQGGLAQGGLGHAGLGYSGLGLGGYPNFGGYNFGNGLQGYNQGFNLGYPSYPNFPLGGAGVGYAAQGAQGGAGYGGAGYGGALGSSYAPQGYASTQGTSFQNANRNGPATFGQHGGVASASSPSTSFSNGGYGFTVPENTKRSPSA